MGEDLKRDLPVLLRKQGWEFKQTREVTQMWEQVIVVRSHDDGEVFSVVRPADALNPQITVDEIRERLPDSIVELITVTSIADFIAYDDAQQS